MNRQNKGLRSQYNVDYIISKLCAGRIIKLVDVGYKCHNYKFIFDDEQNISLHVSSVRAAFKRLNNGFDVGASWFIGGSCEKNYKYTAEHGLLLY
jgi:hypothetical protein